MKEERSLDSDCVNQQKQTASQGLENQQGGTPEPQGRRSRHSRAPLRSSKMGEV